MSEIVLQPMSDEMEEKIVQALHAIGDCMGVEIMIETLSVVKVSWKNAPLLEDVVRTLARNNISQSKKHGNRYSVKPISTEEKIEEGMDPLGS